MHYGEIKNCDIANGEGVRISLFVSGCTNHCENCFQPQTWDFNYGTPFTKETEDELLCLLAPDYINGLTLLGGEPFEPDNQRALLPFLHRVRQELPQKNIWSFTGFTWEELHTPGSYPRWWTVASWKRCTTFRCASAAHRISASSTFGKRSRPAR